MCLKVNGVKYLETDGVYHTTSLRYIKRIVNIFLRQIPIHIFGF